MLTSLPYPQCRRPKQEVNVIVQSQIGLLSVPDDMMTSHEQWGDMFFEVFFVCLHLFFTFEFMVFHDIGIGSNSFSLLNSKGVMWIQKTSAEPPSTQW